MDAMMKKSLGAPLRQLSSCVSHVADCRRGRRRSLTARRRSAPCLSHATHDSWIQAYQTELIRERNLRKAQVAQKNAQRTARRAYVNSPRPVPKNTRNASSSTRNRPNLSHNTRGRSSTPHRTDDSLFGAFQGLSLNVSSPPTAMAGAPPNPECKVM